MWLARTLCDVLEECRKTTQTLNFSYLLGLLEEAQTMANRMEAGLEEKGDRITNLEKELAALRRRLVDTKEETQ